MQLIDKQEIFVTDLDKYFKDKKYNGELIGLYEPDYDDLEIVIKNYAHKEYKFIIYYEHKIKEMPHYDKFYIELDFSKFYNNSKYFLMYQDENYYVFTLKIYEEIIKLRKNINF